MQHHARRMRQRECSADASHARDEAAARRAALAQKRAKAALMRREGRKVEAEMQEVRDIQAFPNPAHQVVQLTNPLSHRVRMIWQDASGRSIKEHSLAPGTHSVSVSDLPAGVYLLRANGLAMGRVQIQR